ncbi:MULTISPECIES: diguanylate cyclase [unclassified Neptuniibacter]|uniref:diguanylate cyclase domain-containing protein n=1 Tax=unclassified Neptuniibacter TaxID=2630693 RepID=UPI000C493468|nr:MULTISPECIES: diguanylate cyclase [unclassified Neptuniibacter]MAY42859.1 serine/threonine protein kinase [Oceanospirillaceae bacterium]
MRSGFKLPGYKVSSVLWQAEGRIVYRALRLSDNFPVAVETLDTEFPDRHQVASIRREGDIGQRLSAIKGVRKVYDLLPHGSGNLALICELFDNSLSSLLQRTGSGCFSLSETVDIAILIAQSLGGIHAHNIVHKALSSGHVLFDTVTNRVAVSGFGIASELDQERQAVQMSRCLEGPLPYISPEQTGRINRDLDYRSDYYSFGVLLYELFTGQLPFQADNVLEWVHSHISRLPVAPHEVSPSVPLVISDIVLKLLSKEPEARYQSAEGIIQDLEQCAVFLAADRDIQPFQLGEKDVIQKFLIPQNLYGRKRELAQLVELFEGAVAGRTEFCLVHGSSGVGKSALVNEIDKPLVGERGFLVQGKFEQYQQGEAYTAFVSAFKGLVQQILTEPEDKLSQWRKKILEALNPNARLIVDLVPELEIIIGEQSDVAKLPPAEERNRLQILLAAFLRVFAGEGHPVVLFLDDLHWSDAPTLSLLKRIVTSREISHLLLIGSYRSNEVGVGHPLRLLFEDLNTHKRIRQLPLGPLDKGSVSQLVANALCCEASESRLLSDMLYHKAQGNPFFINELLRQLHKEGVLTPNKQSRKWDWDLDNARWSNVSNDIVEFMVDNLRQLPISTQNVLQLAACIGSTFDIKTLAAIYEHSVVDTAAALLPALQQHTLLPLNSDYRLVGDSSELFLDVNPTYRFQHDRVQQAAYSLIDVLRLREVHLSVGRLMLQHAGADVPDERLIDIVEHLNEGRSLIDSKDEQLCLAELNLRAGVRARHASAYETALSYLETAVELVPLDPWNSVSEVMFPLAEEMQYCAYLTSRTEQAEEWIGIMLSHAHSDLARGDILATRTRQYATLGKMEASIQSAIQGLGLLGIEFTDDPTDDEVAEERKRVKINLGERSIADLVDAPFVKDESVLTAIRLMMEIFPATFLSGSGNLFPYLVLKAVNLSLRHGNCPESAFAYAAYGMLLCGDLDEPAEGYQYGKVGLAINENLDDLTLRSRVVYVYAMFVHHWSEHWSTLTPLFHKGIEAGYQSGDLLYLAYSAQDCVIWDPSLDLETAHRLHADNLEIVRECAYQDSLDSGTLFLQLQRNLLGLTHSAFTLSDDNFDVQSCLDGMHERQFMTGIANYQIYNAEICLLYGDYEKALSFIKAQDQMIKSSMSLPQLVRFYIVSFLTLTSIFHRMDAEEQAVTCQRLERSLERMKCLADNCEENFRHLQYLMEAELAKINLSQENALERYDASIDAARESGFLRDEATACERAARYLIDLGQRRSAEGYIRAAHRIFDRWGAHRKVTQLKEEFSFLRELSSGAYLTTGGRGISDLDLTSVMKASRDISGEILLDRLLKTTMNILLENAGAQWGCLVARRDGKMVIEAATLPAGFILQDLPNHWLIPTHQGEYIPLPISLLSHVRHSSGAVVLHDAAQEGPFTQDPYMLKYNPLSVLCVPIQRERFEGVLYMENNLATGVFKTERVEIIRLLAAQASVAIENARLYEQVQDYSRTLEDKVAERTARLEQVNQELQGLADRDGLTGVANRRRGDAYLAEAWGRLRREAQPLSVIMLDVDHFKAFNDNYGHQNGDDCLITVAKLLAKTLFRPGDMIARYGGEEFILILPDTDSKGAGIIGEKVRQAVENEAIEHTHSTANAVVTVSVGAATIVPKSGGVADDLVREADIALYRAKKMGRNQVQQATMALNS